MDDEQPATPLFRVLRQTNPCEVVYDHLHGSIGGWTSRRTNSYEMVNACEPTSCFLFTPHHPPFFLYSFPLYSLLLPSLLLLLLTFDVHFLSFCIPIS